MTQNSFTLPRAHAPDLAYDLFLPKPGPFPVILFCSGYKSDRTGSKATALQAWAHENGHNIIRFDYRGSGQSGGVFLDATVADWAQDTLDIIDHVCPKDNPIIVVGSSMGGWMALHAAIMRGKRIAGIVGIAAAPDFTGQIRDHVLTEKQRLQLKTEGKVVLGSALGPDPYVLTPRMFDDGDKIQILNMVYKDVFIPMHLFQGELDPSVPINTPLKIKSAFPNADIHIYMINDGDHGLSRPQDLNRIYEVLLKLGI